ncbi:LysR family transcriptional regulator [Dongia sp.]|uniref:LysR family transcriptional regulator n=1 Tax=Dongia sp. TaxID=1977262 RepID=UPI0035B20642
MQKSGLLELNAVVAVADHRNFRAAAAALGLSPSALSHAVAALEGRLGVRLFNRTTRSVSLTEAGERFLARLRPALRDIDAAMDAVNQFRDTPTGTLRLNTSEGAARQILEPVILAFMRDYPDMQVDLVTEGRFVDIVAEGFDAGIRLAEAVPQDMIAVPIGPDQCFAVTASPGYFADHPRPRTPGDLLGHECIRMRKASGGLYHWEFEKHGEEMTLDVKGKLTLDNHHLIRAACLAGAGIAYLNEPFAAADIKAGRLVRVLADWTPPFPGLCLYYPGHRHVPAGLRAFIDLARGFTAKTRRG